ncbi:hypothetical protein ACQ4LE_007390 [Meloidogyne hapla]|uniref:Uncharacterized protein n=1 Tax=Meloidogyne hapla TaxID=6305 RepID=A0A1I8B7J3_MELHA
MPVLSFVALLAFLLPAVLLIQCCKKKAKDAAAADGGVKTPLDAGKSKAKGSGGKKPIVPEGAKKEKKSEKPVQVPTSTAAGPSLATAFSPEKTKSKTNIKQGASTKTAAVKTKAGAITALPKGQSAKKNEVTAVALEKTKDEKTKLINAGIEKAKAAKPENPVIEPSKFDDGTPTVIFTPADMMSVAAMTANPNSTETIDDKSKVGQKTSASFYDLDSTNKTSDSVYENVDLPKTKSTVEMEGDKGDGKDEDDDDTEKSIMKSKIADEKKAEEQKKSMAASDEYQTLANMSTDKVFQKKG